MASGFMISNTVIQEAADNGFPTVQSESLRLRLFQNDHSPTDDDVIADYDEADYDGYSEFLLSGAWGAGFVGHNYTYTYPTPQTFTADPGADPQVIYGYMIYSDSLGELAWAEAFDTPRTMEPGASLTITPRMQVKTCHG